jgi:hypothetical protein
MDGLSRGEIQSKAFSEDLRKLGKGERTRTKLEDDLAALNAKQKSDTAAAPARLLTGDVEQPGSRWNTYQFFAPGGWSREELLAERAWAKVNFRQLREPLHCLDRIEVAYVDHEGVHHLAVLMVMDATGPVLHELADYKLPAFVAQQLSTDGDYGVVKTGHLFEVSFRGQIVPYLKFQRRDDAEAKCKELNRARAA